MSNQVAAGSLVDPISCVTAPCVMAFRGRGFLHRLDVPTSGLVLTAKSYEVPLPQDLPTLVMNQARFVPGRAYLQR